MLTDLLHRLRALFRRKTVERELNDELRFHFERQVEKRVTAGITRAEAERRARMEFGGIESVKEECREARGVMAIETTVQDVRYAVRTLRKSPAFSAIAAVTLALGIGANSAIFSVVEAVMLRALPYKDPGRLAVFDDSWTYTEFAALKSRSRAFEDMAVYYNNTGRSRVTLTGAAEPEAVQGGFVSANFFPLLGMGPEIGRGFTAEEETRRERVVVLSNGLWSRRFGGSREVIGRTLQIDGINWQVIGVMSASFRFPAKDVQFWAPITTNRHWGEPYVFDVNHGRGYFARWDVVARLKAGVNYEQAQAEMNAISTRLEQETPERYWMSRLHVIPLHVDLSGSTRLGLYVLFAAVSFVLLIACANVANLVLARGAARGREMAVRTALGAGRGRLMRQLFTESAVLALGAACLGVGMGSLGIRALVVFGAPDLPRLDEAGLDGRVLAFTLGVSLLAALIFGLGPAWRISRSDVNDALKSGGRGGSPAPGTSNARSVLVAAEFALSVVLLTGAGLLLRSFLAIEAVDPGFRPEQVLTMQVTLPAGASDTRKQELDELTLERVRAIPGVLAVGAINILFDGQPADFRIRAVDGGEPDHTSGPLTWNTIRGDYMQAMGARLVRGRFFSERDNIDSPLVAMVDETMAHRYWPGEDPIGRRFKGFDQRGHNDEWSTVVGVVADMRRHGRDRQPAAHIYQWYRQSTDPATKDLVVRTAGDPKALAATLRSVVRRLDRTAILSPVMTLEQELSDQLAPRRFQTWLLTLFSLMAVMLASVGIYAVMHYSVAQRTHEIGVRMALGARPENVVRMAIAQGISLAALGLGAGMAGAWWLTRLLGSLLFGVTATDPVTFGAVAVLLTVVAILASAIPALRAARVDPMTALRCD